MSNIPFYVRVTNKTNFVTLGLVGVASDFSHLKKRIQSIFPADEYLLDDMHQLAPLEVRVVHPDCKGILSEECNSFFVESVHKPLL